VCHLSLLLAGSNTATTHYPYSQQKVKLLYPTAITIKPASSHEISITVQENNVLDWSYFDLERPNGYWLRPIGEEQRYLWPFIGAYPWFGFGGGEAWDKLYPNTNPTYNSAYGFVPWVTGPESAHIVWKREYQMGGLMGGDYGAGSDVNSLPFSFSTTPDAIQNGWQMTASIVLMGRAYHAVPKTAPNGANLQLYWECYDIRTGKVYWERPLYPGEDIPTLIEYTLAAGQIEATQPKPASPQILSISNGYLRKYDPNTGVMMTNVSIAPMTGSGGTYYKNGYVLGIQDLGADAGAERYRLINWTTYGNSGDFATRVVSNTTYARSSFPTASMTDWNVGIGCTISSISTGGIYTGMNVTAYDLYTGIQRWTKELAELQYSGSACVADHGAIAVLSAKGYFLALDLKTGNQLWKTESLDYPWDEPGWGAYSTTSAYGQMFWSAQTGIYAIDWATGNINWKFEKAALSFETPYTSSRTGETVYPFVIGSVCADGKLYAYSQRHTPETPFDRGQPTVCIDVFTGEEIWSVGMGGGIFLRRGGLVVADGYLEMAQRYGVLYTFGIGLSETTVSASQVPLALGQKALLTGTVFDLSPAQSGTPCVSKESMAAQMENIHLQSPIGGIYGNVTLVGVPVSLDAVDPNGNSFHIATITSDGYSGTFGYSDWIPEIAGQYTITATFMGDESYGNSFATTYLVVAEDGVENAPSNTVLYAVIGATIAIIAVMLLCFLIFKKK
ncbi:MAG: PQQ-binding-like beta-propeller repeat protein, partial [Candidatus Bathyarchaeota archaeon]|nr:PQQ-binding-like beta-propeller repeat protein [Candidatus Termiticorpusculum sp.]